MKKMVKEIISDVIEYLDNTEMGYSDTIARVLNKLGYDSIAISDLFAIDIGVREEIERTRDYILDMSEYDGKCSGLPFNLTFVKSVK